MVEAAMACVASRLGNACPVPFTFAKLLRTHCLVCLVLSGLNEHDNNTFERYYHAHSLQTRQDTPRQQGQHKPSCIQAFIHPVLCCQDNIRQPKYSLPPPSPPPLIQPPPSTAPRDCFSKRRRESIIKKNVKLSTFFTWLAALKME